MNDFTRPPASDSDDLRSTENPSDFSAILRAIDASANRAVEGLRVVEDLMRFVHNDAHLVRRLKQSRHAIADALENFNTLERMRARETRQDVGTDIRTNQEVARSDVAHLLTANFRRAQEALRSLSECSKLLAASGDAHFDGDANIAESFEQIRYEIYTLEKSATISNASNARLENVQICALVSASAFSGSDAFADYVQRLVTAGIGMVQLREKSQSDADLIRSAKTLRQITSGTGTIFIVNDRADIAAAVDADGVHLGQDDLSVAVARSILGRGKLVGVSTHDIEQARTAVLDGADYLGAGPTFPSMTKSFTEFSGLNFVSQIANEISLPTFAIGGITSENAGSVAEHGVHRVAVQAVLQNLSDSPDLNDTITDLKSALAAGQKSGTT